MLVMIFLIVHHHRRWKGRWSIDLIAIWVTDGATFTIRTLQKSLLRSGIRTRSKFNWQYVTIYINEFAKWVCFLLVFFIFTFSWCRGQFGNCKCDAECDWLIPLGAVLTTNSYPPPTTSSSSLPWRLLPAVHCKNKTK